MRREIWVYLETSEDGKLSSGSKELLAQGKTIAYMTAPGKTGLRGILAGGCAGKLEVDSCVAAILGADALVLEGHTARTRVGKDELLAIRAALYNANYILALQLVSPCQRVLVYAFYGTGDLCLAVHRSFARINDRHYSTALALNDMACLVVLSRCSYKRYLTRQLAGCCVFPKAHKSTPVDD